ncbi:DEAD/DEAH box helicase family protein [Streptomyces viridosporus]|uniref:DEAD/DEAH box helicase family protein n=1 Tax=Streptomyces viridosporus TaxID=67581 RepID=UPI003413187D
MFATYASLVDREDPEDPEGSVEGSGAAGDCSGGREAAVRPQTAGFDLAIVDEAHSTADDLGRPWAAIHDNQRIPADFRLYLTATPRILAAPGRSRARVVRCWRSRAWPTIRTGRTARGWPSSG